MLKNPWTRYWTLSFPWWRVIVRQNTGIKNGMYKCVWRYTECSELKCLYKYHSFFIVTVLMLVITHLPGYLSYGHGYFDWQMCQSREPVGIYWASSLLFGVSELELSIGFLLLVPSELFNGLIYLTSVLSVLYTASKKFVLHFLVQLTGNISLSAWCTCTVRNEAW